MRKPSASMVIAFIALFVASAGSAVAAGGLITGKQIKDKSIGKCRPVAGRDRAAARA
jgi:hypothetical protein